MINHRFVVDVRLALLAGVGACSHGSLNQAPSPVGQTPPRGLPTSSVAANGSVSGQPASAFQSPLAGCPGGNGIHISVNSGTDSSAGSAGSPLSMSDTASRARSVTGSDTASRRAGVAGNDSSSRANTGNRIDTLSTTTSGARINIAVDQRSSIDTTLVFDVAHKTWTRTNLAAAITAGLADQARGGYAICAGVTALIPSANLTINGARGRVHFAATLQSLLNSIQSGTAGTTSQLRRM